MIIVDTSVLLDVFGPDQAWMERSAAALERATAQDDLAINDIVYAELSPSFASIDSLDEALGRIAVTRQALPKLALFVAGQAFRRYRRQGGPRTTILPDFLIGAHAFVERATLLTRDPERVRAYFPTVTLITP